MRIIYSDSNVYAVFLLISLIISTWPSSTFGLEPYSEIPLRLTNESKEILVKYGICKNSSECSINEYVLWDGSDKHVIINLYNIFNIEAINDISSACFDEYLKSGKRTTIELSVYREEHKQLTGLGMVKLYFIKPYVYLKLKGGS